MGIRIPSTTEQAAYFANQRAAMSPTMSPQHVSTFSDVRSRRDHEHFLKELAEVEAAKEAKRLEPFKKLEAQFQANANTLAQMERDNLLVLPDPQMARGKEYSSVASYVERVVDHPACRDWGFSEWKTAGAVGIPAACLSWTTQNILPPTPDEVRIISKWITINGLFPSDELAWQVGLSRLTNVLFRFAPVQQAAPEPVVKEQPVYQPGTPEYIAQERKQVTLAWEREQQPIWLAAVASLQDSSGLELGIENQKALHEAFKRRSDRSRRPIPFSVAEIRKSALTLWPASEVGATEDEVAAMQDDGLSAENYARKMKLGNPRTASYGGPMARPIGYTRGAGQ